MSVRTSGVLGVLALLAAACMVAVSPAVADTPSDYPNVTGTVSESTPPPDWFEREAAKATATTPVRPDDRAGVRGPGMATGGTTIIVAADEFDWNDATIGLAVGIGAMILVGATVEATRHYVHAHHGGRHLPT
jgi:hypothetical protein